jgi:DNA polymerase III epsilon subunit-like protein
MIIFDLETTGTNVFDAEIITGHFLAVDSKFNLRSEYVIQCNPWKWSYEAEQIHGITKEQASKYKKFSEVYPGLLTWLQAMDDNQMWMHTNAKMFGKLTFYDHAVLRLRMMDMGDEPYFEIEKHKPYSTHTLCKVLQSHFNFEGFSLDLICKELGIELKHHDAKSDTFACYEIIKKLLPMTTLEDLYNYEREVENESVGTIKKHPKKSRKLSSVDRLF